MLNGQRAGRAVDDADVLSSPNSSDTSSKSRTQKKSGYENECAAGRYRVCDTRPLYSAVRKAGDEADDENRRRDRSVVMAARLRVKVGIMTRKMAGTAIAAASSPYQTICIAAAIVSVLEPS